MTDLIDRIANQGRSSDSFGPTAELALLVVGTANLPLGLILMVGMYAQQCITGNSARDTPMPDDWLKQASESPDVSPKGLAHLARCLEKRGFVSVTDARAWARIEEAEARKREAERKRVAGVEGDGAQALLQRAKRECPSILAGLDMSQVMDNIRARGQQATNMATTLKDRIWQAKH